MKRQSGMALTVAIVVALGVSLVGASAMSLAYRMRFISKQAVADRTVSYYHAQAGVVDAFEQIRRDAGGNFANPVYKIDDYPIDLDGDGKTDTLVSIGTKNAVTGLRTIRSKGLS